MKHIKDYKIIKKENDVGDILLEFYDSGELVLHSIVNEKPMGMSFSFSNDLIGYDKIDSLDRIIEKLKKKYPDLCIINDLLYIDWPSYSFEKIDYKFRDRMKKYVEEILSGFQFLKDDNSIDIYGIKGKSIFHKDKPMLQYWKKSNHLFVHHELLEKIRKFITLKIIWNRDVDAIIQEYLPISGYNINPTCKIGQF